MAGIYDVLEEQIPLLINKAIMHIEPTVDTLFRTMVSSENVVSDGFSRNWKVRKLLKGSMTGVVQADDTPNVDTIYGASPSGPGLNTTPGRFYFNDGQLSEYPDPTLGAIGRVETMEIPIVAFRGSFELTLAEMRHDNLPALIGNIIPDKIAGVAKQLAYKRAGHMWADDEYGVIATLSSTSRNSAFSAEAAGTYSATEGGTTFYIKVTNDVVNRFSVGQLLSAADSSNNNLTDASGAILPLYVRWVDRLTDRIALFAKGDHSARTVASSITSGVLQSGVKLYTYKANRNGTTNRSINGVNAWLRQGYNASGVNYTAPSTGIYAVPFTEWPELQSFTYQDSGPLTEQKLGRYLDRLNKAFGPHNFSIDTLVANSATLRTLVNNKIGYSVIQRNGSPINLNGEGTSAGITYHHNGKSYSIETSEFPADGTLYGLKVKNNMKRYVPAGRGGSSGLGTPEYCPVEFINPLLGGSSIFDQKRGVNNIVTEMKYAPFDYVMNVVPDQLPGMKITGLSTDKLTPA